MMAERVSSSEKRFRLVFLPFLLAGLAALALLSVLLLAWSDLPAWSAWILVGSFLLVGASLIFFRYRLGQEHHVLEEKRSAVVEERKILEGLREELEKESLRFEKRRQGFESRLMTYHEWTEFPAVTPLAEVEEQSQDELRERDRKVLERVQAASDQVFDGFQSDRYSEDGQFEPRLLVNEVITFAEDIARIYQPDARDPLLETSVEKLVKAINHISLQLLFQLEQIPFNLKEYSLAKAYDHIRTASKFYQYYKNLGPYLPYANYTWHVGRLVLTGANPITTGTWMLGSEFVRRTGKKISKHYVDRYTLKMIGEAIRILGNEAAMIFDDDYRYRDPNWVYGQELAEMVYQFPLSRQTLQQALSEVGGLPLRNSYDRVFLYRCLALGRSPQVGRVQPGVGLTTEQRHQIAERLERFLWKHVRGRRPDLVEKWMGGASERLGVALKGPHRDEETNAQEAMASCLASLGAFLIAVKDERPEEVERLLKGCHSVEHLDEERRRGIIEHLLANPPMFFDYPNLGGSSPLVPSYFGDLAELEAHRRPADLQGFLAVREAAEYYRLDGRVLEDQLAKAYAIHFKDSLWPTSPEKEFGKALVFALIHSLTEDEKLLFVYAKVAVEVQEAAAMGIRVPGLASKPTYWLLGSDRQLLVVEVNEALRLDDFHRHRVIWRLPKEQLGGGEARLERNRRLVRNQGIIYGGRWLSVPPGAGGDLPGVVLSGEALKRGDGYYAAIEEWMSPIG